MRSYTIHSLDTLAIGAQLDYEIGNTTFKQGTKISAEYLDSNDFPIEAMVRGVKAVCAKSHLDIEVIVNGEKVTEKLNWGTYKKNLIGKDGNIYGNIYVDESKKSSYINVLANGLFSFVSYAAHEIDATTINIIVPSKEAFSQSRDNFKYGPVYDAFNKMQTEMAQNSKSWHKRKQPIKVLKGKNNYWRVALEKVAAILNTTVEKLEQSGAPIKGIFSGGNIDNYRMELSNFIAGRANNPHQMVEIERVINQLDNTNSAHDQMEQAPLIPLVDFYIDLSDSGFAELPDEYHPIKGMKRNRLLVGMWKAILEDVIECNGKGLNFSTGFSFETDTVAAHKNHEGIEVFFINPTKEMFVKGEIKNRFWTMYAAAMHEVSHHLSPNSCHDESFARELTYLTAKCLAETKGYVKVMGLAREYSENL